MKTNETSTRRQALAWWKKLCLSCELDDTHYVLDNLMRKHIGFERKYHSLTGREIEEIWRRETEEGSDREILEYVFPDLKPNQKHFKKFNEDLFKAYISKFSENDRYEMLRVLSESFQLNFCFENSFTRISNTVLE